MLLCDATASVRRLALVGMAKNTGKTVALVAALQEFNARGETVGVTSIGRDGEHRDVIDASILKQRLLFERGTLVATTETLLRDSALAATVLERTTFRTSLGRVAIARLEQRGALEVAGPVAAADIRAVADAMLDHGADRVLIDGAIDRRASASPSIADGVVLSTGAALDADPSEVARRTREAVGLLRLPLVADRDLRTIATRCSTSAVVSAEGVESLPIGALLGPAARRAAERVAADPDARWVLVKGALGEPFVRALVELRVGVRGVGVAVAGATRVFLSERGCDWYRRRGIAIEALAPIAVRAITVNPASPEPPQMDATRLRHMVREAVPDVHVFNVMDPDYLAERAAA